MVHTYISNPLGHVVRFANLAVIRCVYCRSFSMNGKPKAGIVDVAGVVDVGQSLKWRVCSESSVLLNTVSLELDRYTHTHTHKNEGKQE